MGWQAGWILLGLEILLQVDSGHCSSRTDTKQGPIKPDAQSARNNAHHIFNAIHSAGRQWGSSLNHNGFGFYPAVMPEGTLTYHGSRSSERPRGLEWLAFQEEHAENFAQSYDPKKHRHPMPPPSDGDDDQEQSRVKRNEDNTEGSVRGYFHTYRARRDISLLYVDGTSAGGGEMGTSDSQTLVLRQHFNDDDAWDREAPELCKLAKEWGYDGIMRMEIGFEIIYCNFKDDGLEEISVVRTLAEGGSIEDPDERIFAWARGAGERYDGLGGGRVRFDFSSMVSGFMFPINISSTDPDRPDLIRYEAADRRHMLDIKNYVERVSLMPRRFNVDWQSVVDMVITRFAQRLARMRSDLLSDHSFITEVEMVTLTYFDAPSRPDDVEAPPPPDWGQDPETSTLKNRTTEAIQRCATYPFSQAEVVRHKWSVEDELIHTALLNVTTHICTTLFSIRSLLLATAEDGIDTYWIPRSPGLMSSHDFRSSLQASRYTIRSLTDTLSWTVWKKLRACPVDQIEFVAMWPFGEERDHWNPGCREPSHFGWESDGGNSYWNLWGTSSRSVSKDGWTNQEL